MLYLCAYVIKLKAYLTACICNLSVCILYYALPFIIVDWPAIMKISTVDYVSNVAQRWNLFARPQTSHDDMHDIFNKNDIKTDLRLCKFAIKHENQNNPLLANFVITKDEEKQHSINETAWEMREASSAVRREKKNVLKSCKIHSVAAVSMIVVESVYIVQWRLPVSTTFIQQPSLLLCKDF